tara:strand:- start:214 stop:672 length:459 start_codon:yes stop_codon:yes gene_type:complete
MNLSVQLKVDLQEYCLTTIEDKYKLLTKQILARKQDLVSASKSSAGDKHETSRAMIHLEQEKLGIQFQQVHKQQLVLSQIEVKQNFSIQSGSLILTNKALFYIAIALGKLMFNNQEIFVISPVSPLAQAFLNSKSSKEICFHGTTYTVLAII